MTERSSLRRLGCISTLLALAAIAALAACGGSGSSPNDSAFGTATAMIENAQATVLVMQAQAMATALVETLSAPLPQAMPELSPTPAGQDTSAAIASPQTTPGKIEIVAVTTAAEGSYIMVQFRGPARLVSTWYQGRVSVTDERTGAVYIQIPSVGTIGPLISRPSADGQLGYVMLVNKPEPLKAGDVVTVVLGDFKQEHLVIQ